MLTGTDRINTSEATSFGRYQGFEFFEHPVYGDEHPIVAVHVRTRAQFYTGAYELEEARFWVDDFDGNLPD